MVESKQTVEQRALYRRIFGAKFNLPGAILVIVLCVPLSVSAFWRAANVPGEVLMVVGSVWFALLAIRAIAKLILFRLGGPRNPYDVFD